MKAILPLLSLLFIQPVPALEVLGVVGSVVPAKPYYETLLAKRPKGISVELDSRDIQRSKKWSGNYGYESALTSGSFESFTLTPDATKQLMLPLLHIFA